MLVKVSEEIWAASHCCYVHCGPVFTLWDLSNITWSQVSSCCQENCGPVFTFSSDESVPFPCMLFLCLLLFCEENNFNVRKNSFAFVIIKFFTSVFKGFEVIHGWLSLNSVQAISKKKHHLVVFVFSVWNQLSSDKIQSCNCYRR